MSKLTRSSLEELGDKFVLSGNYSLAAKTFHSLAEAYPKEIDYQLKLAGIFINQGELDLAQLQIELAKQIDREDYRIYFLKGTILIVKGLLKEALYNFNKAKELDNNNLDEIAELISQTKKEILKNRS